jgi:hypothetical protein
MHRYICRVLVAVVAASVATFARADSSAYDVLKACQEVEKSIKQANLYQYQFCLGYLNGIRHMGPLTYA